MTAPAPSPVLPSRDTAPPLSAEETYRERSTGFAAQYAAYDRRWNLVANIRLAVFIVAAACLGWGLFNGPLALTLAGLALFVVFVALVAHHLSLGRLRHRYAELRQINDEALMRLARDWNALPLRHTVSADPAHPYAADLDIFGHASLFHLLDTTGTYLGETTLRDWLLATAPPDAVRERQAAVAELAPQSDFRDELALRARILSGDRPDPEPFLAWAESEPWMAKRPGLLWTARISVLLLWISIIAQLTGLLPGPLWIGFVILNWYLRWGLARPLRPILNAVSERVGAFRAYGDALEVLSTARFTAPMLRRIAADLSAGDLPAYQQMARLGRRANFVYPEDNLLNIPIQLFTLWDLHVAASLEAWQAVAGQRARGWLRALGEAEALSALSGRLFDNPDWTFPDFDPAALALDARALGHPLLPPTACVVNDVSVGPAGTFLLVTGSNMSGKSTLLRAIGVNIVLAGAGGPVFAASLDLPPVTLWTSMRIQDSLEQGVSYFMAELNRLKDVVDAARLAHDGGGPRLFYLLDEILQGTNTAERQIAARRIISYLVAEGALGAVSTHDLTLADAPETAAVAHPIHFTESFTSGPDGPAMTFDYKIRPGIATSTNALRLMEIVGLDLDR
ncbi:MAG: MutS-related protein [Chloroflexia bacterium]